MRFRKASSTRWLNGPDGHQVVAQPAAARDHTLERLATSAALTRFAWISKSPNRIRELITSSSKLLDPAGSPDLGIPEKRQGDFQTSRFVQPGISEPSIKYRANRRSSTSPGRLLRTLKCNRAWRLRSDLRLIFCQPGLLNSVACAIKNSHPGKHRLCCRNILLLRRATHNHL